MWGGSSSAPTSMEMTTQRLGPTRVAWAEVAGSGVGATSACRPCHSAKLWLMSIDELLKAAGEK
jgi:hypothetical protein